jgi:hypothetical protein
MSSHKSSDDSVEVVMLDMTPELKEKFKRISLEIVELLQRELNPLEAAAVLQFVLDGMKECYDIKRTVMFGNETEKLQ